MNKSKRAQIWGTLIPWLIAAVVLVLMLILYMLLKGKGQGAIDYLRTILRFGR